MAPNNSSKAIPSATLGKNPVSASHASAITKAVALEHFGAAASIGLVNGTVLVEDGAAFDQAHMRAGQLSGLLMLMRADDATGFRMIGEDMQRDVMWLASQLAEELHALLPLVAEEQRREKRA